MEVNNNPLKQYFRRPAIYLKLPSGGKFYNEKDVSMPENGELPVYPMTAIDDITVKTPDALFNGQAVADIIKSCIPNIKNPWAVINVDLDAIFLAIRAASSNDGMDITSICTECNKPNEFKLNLAGMLNTLKSPNFDEPLQLGDLTIYFRPLNYKDVNAVSLVQVELQKAFSILENMQNEEERTKKTAEAMKNITNITVETLAKSIKTIQGPNGIVVTETNFINEYLRGCDKNNFEIIRDHVAKLKQESSLKPMHVKCMHCSHEYDQLINLNMTDFFG